MLVCSSCSKDCFPGNHHAFYSAQHLFCSCVPLTSGFRTDGDRDAVTVLTRPNTITIRGPGGVDTIIPVPQCIQEVDQGHTVGFGADLAEDHPVRAAVAAAAD